jgi:predicted Zn-dependent peptidase
VVGCYFPGSDVAANPPVLPAFPPLEFHPPKPERFVLSNGLVVFLLEDHELPLIKVNLRVRAGSIYDPADKVGLSGVFGPTMALGGSLNYTPEQIQRVLDTTASSLSFSVGTEEGAGSLSCSTTDFNTIFPIFSDLLMNPRFDNHFFAVEKDKALEALRRMNDEPEEIARREFRILAYGKAHPYARVPTPDTIGAIKRKDLMDLHARYFKPNATWLAVSGDFRSAEMKATLEKSLGAWPQGELSYPPVPAVTSVSQRQVAYVQKPLDQSQIRIGHLGLKRHNPDHFAWEVFNELWGGNSASILFREVRTQLGLAYAVGSTFSEPRDRGLIVAVCQTRGPETTQAIRSILDVTQQARQASFTAEEIDKAKESIRNRFIENFTSSQQITEQAMELEYNGFPKDYLDTYTAKIAQVSGADLKRVAQTYLRPDQAIILVVGDLSTFNQPLSVIGPPRALHIPDYSEEEL